MSESQYDYLDADTLQKDYEGLAGLPVPTKLGHTEYWEGVYDEGLPLSIRQRLIKVAMTGEEIEAIIENEKYRALTAPRSIISRVDQPYFTGIFPSYQDVMNTSRRVREYMESASPPFDRVPNHNNQLLLLL